MIHARSPVYIWNECQTWPNAWNRGSRFWTAPKKRGKCRPNFGSKKRDMRHCSLPATGWPFRQTALSFREELSTTKEVTCIQTKFVLRRRSHWMSAANDVVEADAAENTDFGARHRGGIRSAPSNVASLAGRGLGAQTLKFRHGGRQENGVESWYGQMKDPTASCRVCGAEHYPS